MKKIALLIISALLMPTALFAQTGTNQPVPADPAVRTGVLDNGLRYYIRYNNYPAGLAHFEIFHSVGALQEENNQNGLAHFLEHMAFNGLGHFPGKSMMDYMESIGVKWGANLNAATSTDYTRYLIKDVPATRQGIIDTCLLVLYDWSGSILADEQTLDNERGVIEEEWRSRGGAQFRVSNAVMPYVYNFSKYADRNVIGDMDIIRNFTRDELMDFYHTWYRPDLQAIAIVGDFDVDRMERDVVKLFSTLPKAVNPIAKEQYDIPDNDDLLFVAYSDPEVTESSIEILYKHPSTPDDQRNLTRAYIDGYYNHLVTSMMNRRVREKLSNGDYPASSIDYSYSILAGDRDVFSVSTSVRSGAENMAPALELTLAESERMRRYGFTQGEVDRAVASARNAVERSVLQSDKRTNGTFINAYFANFLRNSPYMSIETYRDLLFEALDGFTLEEANARARSMFGNDNRVMTVVTPEREASGIFTEQYAARALDGMGSLSVEPYREKQLPPALITERPASGRVVAEKESFLGSTEWTLSNGAKVYLLPTDLHQNEIQMYVFSDGGHSLVPDDMFASARMVAGALTASGVGDFSASDVSRILTGKEVYVTPFYSEYMQGFDCKTNPADLEATLQLLNLYFTAPRFDAEAMQRRIAQSRESLVARRDMPMASMQDTVGMRRSDYHPRASVLITDPDELDLVDLGQIESIYGSAFGNPQQFTYILVGTLDLAKVRPLVETYIGSLGGHEGRSTWKDLGKRSPKGRVTADFSRPMEQPSAMIFVEYTREIPEYTAKKGLTMSLLQQLLEIRLTNVFRQERGATYTVDMEGSLSRMPVPEMHLIVSFQTKPDLLDGLAPLIDSELRAVAREGIDEAELAKAKEYTGKRLRQNLENNMYWEGRLRNYLQYGATDAFDQQTLDQITAEDIRTALAELLDAGNVLTVIMRPE